MFPQPAQALSKTQQTHQPSEKKPAASLTPIRLSLFPPTSSTNEKNLTYKHGRVTFRSPSTPLPSPRPPYSLLKQEASPSPPFSHKPLNLPQRNSTPSYKSNNITTAILGFGPITRSSILCLSDYDIIRRCSLWRSQATPILISLPSSAAVSLLIPPRLPAIHKTCTGVQLYRTTYTLAAVAFQQ